MDKFIALKMTLPKQLTITATRPWPGSVEKDLNRLN